MYCTVLNLFVIYHKNVINVCDEKHITTYTNLVHR